MLNTPVNGKIQGLFKAFECFSSTFQGKFKFQGLFKTVLYIQVLFKPVRNPAYLISSRAINYLTALQALKLYTYHQQHSFLPLEEEGVVVLLPRELAVVEGVVPELEGAVVAEVVGSLTPMLLPPLLLPLPHLVLKE